MGHELILEIQFNSVTQLCLTLCNPMGCSRPGFPVHHQLLELAQIHVRRVSDDIKPSHPLSSPFSSCLQTFPASRSFPNESVLRIRWPQYLCFSISLSNEYSGQISFRIDWLDLFVVQETIKSLLQHHCLKASVLRCSAFMT